MIYAEIDASIGFSEIYDRLETAQIDIAKDIKGSTFFGFLGLRGQKFLYNADNDNDSIMAKVLKCRGSKICKKILVSNPLSEEIYKRLKNLNAYQDETEMERKWRNDFNSVVKLKRQLEIIAH